MVGIPIRVGTRDVLESPALIAGKILGVARASGGKKLYILCSYIHHITVYSLVIIMKCTLYSRYYRYDRNHMGH